MSYGIHTHRGMGAYAHTGTLAEAVAVAAQSSRETGRRAWIISDDESEGIGGKILCHDAGTRISPRYIPYTAAEYAEERRLMAEQAAITAKIAAEDAAMREAMLSDGAA